MQVVPLLHIPVQQSAHVPNVVPPGATQLTQVPALHLSEPASLSDKQSPSTLHSTHAPVALQMSALASLLEVHGAPADASVKLGPSGPVPLPPMPPGMQDGFDSHADVGVGRSVASSTDVSSPVPSHTTFWQSPSVCSEAGATVLPG